ncbi:hypothetical protein MQE22_07950 [Acidithiobacillus sp. YTS05]|nr:hypothetical protein MQE22_07950 [Acidithiobacillus sp. YTS05]
MVSVRQVLLLRGISAGRVFRWLLPIWLASLTGCATWWFPSVNVKQQPKDFLHAVERLPGVNTGPRGEKPVASVFIDVSCPFCRDLYADLRPVLPYIRLHWIPIGSPGGKALMILPNGLVKSYHTASTLESSAYLLIAYNGAEALDRAMTGSIAVPTIGAGQEPAVQAAANNYQALWKWKPLGGGVPAGVIALAPPADYVVVHGYKDIEGAILGAALQEKVRIPGYPAHPGWTIMAPEGHVALPQVGVYRTPQRACAALPMRLHGYTTHAYSANPDPTVCRLPGDAKPVAYAVPFVAQENMTDRVAFAQRSGYHSPSTLGR